MVAPCARVWRPTLPDLSPDHLYRAWPQFGLEEEGQQWFDRSTWPEDVVGTVGFRPSRLCTPMHPLHERAKHTAHGLTPVHDTGFERD